MHSNQRMDFNDSQLFEPNPFTFYFRRLYRDIGLKAFYQFLNRPHYRPATRALFSKYAPSGIGLEVGVGARTVAPVNRTVLSDGYADHGTEASIAKAFFHADSIPCEDNFFSFIFSEHMLEHSTNPIKVLKEWIRTLKEEGVIIITLPHKDRGNDRYRECTTLKHVIEDYEKDVPNNDPTHLADWMENVVGKDLLPDHYKHMNPEEWLNTGSIHHHVWVTENIIELFEYLGLEVIYSCDRLYDRRDSFVVVGQKK